ncbi:DUF222 domain-containing protein [Mycobacterium sp. NPDC003449]
MFALLDLPSLTDAALIDALENKTRAEAVAAAERLALIGEIVARHCDDEDDARAHLAIDGWEIATAAVGAACNLGRHAASAQMRIAHALRERLPKVADEFARGEISAKVTATITWRTQLVIDPEALALVDAALAGTARSYGTLSVDKAEQAIDVWVEKFDPAAVRRARHGARGRDVNFGDPDDPNGTVSIWGRLLATDAAMLKKTLTEIAGTVCDADPRTMAQRRSDALGALAAGAQRLTCLCGTADCPAAGADPRSSSVVIHLLTDQLPTEDTTADDAAPPCAPRSTATRRPQGFRRRPHPQGHRQSRRHPRRRHRARTVVGRTDRHRRHRETRRRRRHTRRRGRYRIPAKLAAFVRLRDMKCMFPGCGVAAQHCDLDHAIPWPQGPTHPGNLGAKCRSHHLLKTLPAAEGGWADVQHPDGSHTWTAPTGHTYRTTPFGQILFPQWQTQTTPPPAGPALTPRVNRDVKMPARIRTRDQTRTQRINAERRLNGEGGKAPPY